VHNLENSSESDEDLRPPVLNSRSAAPATHAPIPRRVQQISKQSLDKSAADSNIVYSTVTKVKKARSVQDSTTGISSQEWSATSHDRDLLLLDESSSSSRNQA